MQRVLYKYGSRLLYIHTKEAHKCKDFNSNKGLYWYIYTHERPINAKSSIQIWVSFVIYTHKSGP